MIEVLFIRDHCPDRMNQKELKPLLRAVYSRCFRMLRDPVLAEDALQEVMLKFFEKNREKTIHEPLRYLYRSSTNHCLNLLKSKHRKTSSFEDLPSVVLYQEGVGAAEARVGVRELLEEFGEDAASLLVYRHVDQMTLQEIGEIYGITDRGAKKRLDKLESKVRTHFDGTDS